MKKVLTVVLALTLFCQSAAFAAGLSAEVNARTNNGKAEVSVTYMNTSDKIVPIWVFTGIYNADKTVKEVHIKGALAQPNMYKEGTKAYSYNVANGESVKAFLWDKATIYAYAPAANAVPLVEKTETFDGITIEHATAADGYTLDGVQFVNSEGENVSARDVELATSGSLSTSQSDFSYRLNKFTDRTISAVDGALYVDQSQAYKYSRDYVVIGFEPVSAGVVTISFDTKITRYYNSTNAKLDFGSLYSSDYTGDNGDASKAIVNTLIGNSGIYNTSYNGERLLSDTKEWHNMKYVVSFDDKTVKFYIDNELKGEYEFAADVDDVGYIRFQGVDTGAPSSVYNQYYIDNLKITNKPIYESAQTALGLSEEAIGDMTTGQVTQYDISE